VGGGEMSGYLPDGLTTAESYDIFGDPYEEKEMDYEETMPDDPTPAAETPTGSAEAPGYSAGSAGPFSLDELRRLEKDATPGPWERLGSWPESHVVNRAIDHIGICYMDGLLENRKADAALIVAMRNALPGLLDAIEQARTHLRVALLQQHPSDDQIILGHVRDALAWLEGRNA
jgi:hypothetical protein